jgi:hypothetical protein
MCKANVLLFALLIPVECWIGTTRPFGAPKTALPLSTSVPSPRVEAAEDGLDTKAADRGRGAISMTISELSQYMGGIGRAKIVWDCYNIGVDPQNLFGPADAVVRSLGQDDLQAVIKLLPSGRRAQKLGEEALQMLAQSYGLVNRVEDGVASLSHLSTSSDSTTKMLLRLHDGLEVETVIIPADGRSTLCVSSQVGCRQGAWIWREQVHLLSPDERESSDVQHIKSLSSHELYRSIL